MGMRPGERDTSERGANGYNGGMQVTEGLVIDAAMALSKAGASGLALGELAAVLWPDAGVRANGACGSVVAELQRRGVATITPGGKRRRIALTDAGRRWIETASVVEDAADTAELLEGYTSRHAPPRVAPSAGPTDPIEAALQAIMLDARASDGMPADTPWAERNARIRAMAPLRDHRDRERLRAACGGDAVLLEMAEAELARRVRRRVLELEARCRAAGVDPHDPVIFG